MQEIKKRLMTDQKAIIERLSELKLQDPFSDPEHSSDNAANDNDAREEEGHDRISAQIDELNSQLSAIEKALKKMEDGNYGICEVTGQQIPKERLMVFPTATTIVLPEESAK